MSVHLFSYLPLSGNQRPDLLTSLMNMSPVLCLPCEMHLSGSSSNVSRLSSFLDMLQNPHVLLTFGKVQNPLHLRRKTTSELFIFHLATSLRTRRFREPKFRSSGATNHWKNAVFHDLPTFSPTFMFFSSLTFSSDYLI